MADAVEIVSLFRFDAERVYCFLRHVIGDLHDVLNESRTYVRTYSRTAKKNVVEIVFDDITIVVVEAGDDRFGILDLGKSRREAA